MYDFEDVISVKYVKYIISYLKQNIYLPSSLTKLGRFDGKYIK